MISIQTNVLVRDNTGIKKAQCLKIFKKRVGHLGDIILITVKKLKTFSSKKIKINKGDLLKGIIIRTKYSTKNTIGNYITFYENSIVLLNNKNNLLGNRIFGPIPSKFRKYKNLKLLILANYIL